MITKMTMPKLHLLQNWKKAEKLLADIAGGSFAGTQDEVNQMAKELKAAQDALNEKEQTPQVNKDTLKEQSARRKRLI